MFSTPCGYSLGGGEPIETRAALAAAVGPITSAREALAMVAVIDEQVWVPISEVERAQIPALAEVYGWRPPPTALPAVQIEEHARGFVVRAPSFRRCGCDHHLMRRSFLVDRAGVVCTLDEPELMLAYSSKGACVD